MIDYLVLDNQSMGLVPGEDLLSSRQLQIACNCGLCETCSVDTGISTLGIAQEGLTAMLLRAHGHSFSVTGRGTTSQLTSWSSGP